MFSLGRFTSTDVYELAGSTATVNITNTTVTPPPTPPTSVTPEPFSFALLGAACSVWQECFASDLLRVESTFSRLAYGCGEHPFKEYRAMSFCRCSNQHSFATRLGSQGEYDRSEKRGREVTRLFQKVMHCPCGEFEGPDPGFDATCYTLKRPDEECFGGLREAVLVRDGDRCHAYLFQIRRSS